MRIGSITQNFEISQVQPKPVESAPIAPEAVIAESPVAAQSTPAEAVAKVSSADKVEAKIDQELLDKSLKQANKSLAAFNRVISREVHEVTGSVIYKIVDIDTKKVIAEFPPKKIQDMIAKMWELAGLFVDEKA